MAPSCLFLGTFFHVLFFLQDMCFFTNEYFTSPGAPFYGSMICFLGVFESRFLVSFLDLVFKFFNENDEFDLQKTALPGPRVFLMYTQKLVFR